MIHNLSRDRWATGAIKEEIFWGDIPEDHDDALAHLMQVKDRALAEVE